MATLIPTPKPILIIELWLEYGVRYYAVRSSNKA